VVAVKVDKRADKKTEGVERAAEAKTTGTPSNDDSVAVFVMLLRQMHGTG